MSEQKFPPRVWVKLNNDCGDLCLDFKGIAPMFSPSSEYGLPDCDTEYLSLEEHNFVVAELKAENERICRIAEEWMHDYDKLKNKYEPMIAVTSEQP